MNPPSPTVGVAIPFWTRVDFLELALASLVAQTDPDFTAVVIDDCSPEPGAEAAVQRLGDQRVRYVRNAENLGLSRNFNRCLAEPGTEVVAILHADDVFEPGYVAAVRQAHRDAPDAAIVAPMATAIDAEGTPVTTLVDRIKRARWPRADVAELRGDAGLARLMHTFFVYTPALSYRVGLLGPDPFPDRWKQVMDVELDADVLLGGGRFVLLREPVYRYRRHAGTTTAINARSFTRLAEETAMCREIGARARAMGWRRTSFACRLRWSIRLNGAVALLGSLRGGAVGRWAAFRDVFSLR